MTQKPWLATILTNADQLPPMEAVQASLKKIPGYETLQFEPVSQEANHYVFRMHSALLAVTLTEVQADPEAASVPFSELKKACSRAWHWVDAAMEVPKANRQLLAAVLPDEDGLEPLDTALLLTCLTVAILKNTPAIAVYWNCSGMLHEPLSFMEHAVGINRQTIPVELWVEFRLILNSDLTLSIGTWGMKAFALAELEVSHSRHDAQWLLRWLFNLAHLMLENGPLDTEMEHTFGQSDKESFTLTYARSAPEIQRDGLEDVLNVQFEISEKPRSDF